MKANGLSFHPSAVVNCKSSLTFLKQCPMNPVNDHFSPDLCINNNPSPPPSMVSLQASPTLDHPAKGLLMRLPTPTSGGSGPDAPTLPGLPTPGAASWCARPEMIPFLSLCSRYPGPWAGLLQQSMKEKQKMVSRKKLQIISN